jgi:hypothetical protein
MTISEIQAIAWQESQMTPQERAWVHDFKVSHGSPANRTERGSKAAQ